MSEGWGSGVLSGPVLVPPCPPVLPYPFCPVYTAYRQAEVRKRERGLLSSTHTHRWDAVAHVNGIGLVADTIYLTTADSEGNMVSWIQSNYYPFGSGLAAPGLGFALQNRGSLFRMAPAGSNNIYAPGKRPFHTIIPGFLTKEGEPVMSFGYVRSHGTE